ncbi:glycoside hydrolase [Rossellomorea marisflavi]|uniref:GH32 C-terminal domain-containing protein n=1 Tax=Rossellomorea marisflavi TaxID=189381 RepID=UPI001317B174|nr:GH32 C-terminal domain-containing protein [Rossellomorea marisflavi]QHA35040.1 glycoside hydrolase [Rossellomorea marisflavi]
MKQLYQIDFSEGKGNTVWECVREKNLHVHYVFNEAKYKASVAPRWIRSSILRYALDFDGYSTWIEDEGIIHNASFTISIILAPRCFEACHGEVATALIDQLDRDAKTGFALGLFEHGIVQLEIGNGEEIQLIRTDKSLRLAAWSQVSAVYDEDQQRIAIFINGVRETEMTATFAPSETSLSIGKSSAPFKIGNYFSGGMFSGVIDSICMLGEALGDDAIWKEASAVNSLTLVSRDIELDEARLLDDPHRPQFHAIPPQHWMNEPHAPFYYQGKYHLFYQKNASGPYFSHLHWGHWTSDDMVFWENEPTALIPEKKVSPSGVWSGSATIGPDGSPLLFYTSADFSKTYNQGVGVAKPKDVHDGRLLEWDLGENVVIEQTVDQGIPSQFRDPFVWKDEDEDQWYLINGGGIEDQGPVAWLYTSNDCRDWTFKGEFFSVDHKEYPHLGTNWELPVFLPISDEKGNRKFVFLFMSYFHSGPSQQVDTYYYIGEFHRGSHTFIPDTPTPRLLDYGRFKFSGPSGFVDPVSGKSVVFSILQGNRTEQEEYDSGWAHNAGLPIELSLHEGELIVRPLENLQSLRARLLVDEVNQSIKSINQKLESLRHKMIEVLVEFEETDEKVGVELKKDPEGLEVTRLLFDPSAAVVSMDRRNTCLDKDGDWHGGEVVVEGGLRVHLFVDHSAIECFIQNKRMISTRAYPSLPESDHISLIGRDETRIASIKVYELKSIWKPKEAGEDNDH